MNIFEQGAQSFTNANGFMGQAGQSLGQAGDIFSRTAAPGALLRSMNTYMSPYISKVINDSVSRLRDRKAIDLNGVAANAMQGDAYGGSRHGVVEADLIDSYGRNEDELASRLLQQGFDTSAQLGAQELGFMQNAASGLTNIGNSYGGLGQISSNIGQTQVGVGRQLNADQMQSGTMQQQLLQAILGQASGQFDAYQNSPMDSVTKLLSAISGNPLAGNVSQTYEPGMYDYLGMGAGVLSAGK
jgi:hypothetical protein